MAWLTSQPASYIAASYAKDAMLMYYKYIPLA